MPNEKIKLKKILINSYKEKMLISHSREALTDTSYKKSIHTYDALKSIALVLILIMYTFKYTGCSSNMAVFGIKFYIDYNSIKRSSYTFNNYQGSSSNCKLCTYKVRNSNKANSTPRDVLITVSIGKPKSIVLFLKTLRTTGSNCTVVFLFDHTGYISIDESTRLLLEECGGIALDCGDVPYKDTFQIHNYCYVFVYEFLIRNKDAIDRAIICDLYDTVFQGDPFNNQVNKDVLNIVDEGIPLFMSKGDLNWQRSFGEVPLSHKLSFFLCTGYMGSSPEVLIRAIQVFFQILDINMPYGDQSRFNYIWMSGMLKKAGVHVNHKRFNELVRHTSKIKPSKGSDQIGEVRQIRNHAGYASVIHHYYKNENLMKSFLKYCPRESLEMTDYIDKRDEEWVRAAEKELLLTIPERHTNTRNTTRMD